MLEMGWHANEREGNLVGLASCTRWVAGVAGVTKAVCDADWMYVGVCVETPFNVEGGGKFP